ncbi:hypothetical protein QQS21_001365 [Conoideocrella luteorostrata]|uniref:Cupin type-1 domain-containing protein n=1 Tax=Conoideocrella luteorostrata TaxID=1105319 RepID=A0AAJ0D034_9HYPO|nr:hypothetical protein QQS21_001365 [Conoideocrella luteorostrata]
MDVSEALPPELHVVAPTPHVPNSKLPVMLYRKAFLKVSYDEMIKVIEGNGWAKGSHWGVYPTAHFHSNSHECYAIIRGKGTYVLGKSPIDNDVGGDGEKIGRDLLVEQGDIVVLPAGVSHAVIAPEEDWEVVTFYPEGSPQWDMNFCKDGPEETAQKSRDCSNVPIPPKDPVFGIAGPLPEVWKNVSMQ